jgi:hypothetical protein
MCYSRYEENCNCQNSATLSVVIFNIKNQIKSIIKKNWDAIKQYKKINQSHLKFNSNNDIISLLLFFDGASLKKTGNSVKIWGVFGI